jgi:hypothetical protein
VTLAVVVLLCGGAGAGAGYVVLRDRFVTDVRVVTPATLAGRSKITDPEIERQFNAIESTVRDDPAITSTATAMYGDLARRDLLAISAGSGRIRNQKRFLASMRDGLTRSGVTVLHTFPTEPGPYGGLAECGDATALTVSFGVCVWVDRGSFGSVFRYFATGRDLERDFVAIRGEIEQRG